jgi:hypothetical protein
MTKKEKEMLIMGTLKKISSDIRCKEFANAPVMNIF